MAPNNNNNKKKKNRNKNKKASGGNGGGTGGNHNHNHNHNHNNSTIPTSVATAAAATTTVTMTTTSLETTEYINKFNTEYALTDYPKSKHYAVGMDDLRAGRIDVAAASFVRGAKNEGCVGCMFNTVCFFKEFNDIHLVLPWALECSIRGHTNSMGVLVNDCYNKSIPEPAPALSSFWVKTKIELGDTTTFTEEERKEHKKNTANICYICLKEDTVDKAFEKCGICKYYSYCGKDCQTYHWKEQNHMGECRHLQILREYCKPRHVKEIRAAISNGDDPTDIPRLQNLRTALGLNRPAEEYEELWLRLGDESAIQNRNNYLTARKDGTVHIGSTPEAI